MHETHKQLLRFIVVGLGSVAVDLSVYRLLGWSVGLPLFLAKALSFLAGVVVGFIGNKWWTFQSPRKSLAEPITHLALYSVTLFVNVGCNQAVLVMLGPQATVLAYLTATAVTTVLNFLGMRLVTFRHGIQERQQPPAVECDGSMAQHSTVRFEGRSNGFPAHGIQPQGITNMQTSSHAAKPATNVRIAPWQKAADRPARGADAAPKASPLRRALRRFNRGGLLTRPYAPGHEENRMRHEGDTLRAREFFFHKAPQNLKVLLKHRYEWMNRFIGRDDLGVEVGCGTGISREFIRSSRFHLSDVADYDWLDYKYVDAMCTPFADGSFDFVVSSNMIHHVAQPLSFFREMERILKPGGRLIIQEVNASLAMRIALRLMRHEGYSYEPNVFDPEQICNDPVDPWSANCAIPNLLFDNREEFERHVPAFRMVHASFREFASMFNCGGVIAKTFCVPLPKWMVHLMYGIDTILTAIAPGLFAMQRQIVLEKRDPQKASLSVVCDDFGMNDSSDANGLMMPRRAAA